jgi:hypothetical protein
MSGQSRITQYRLRFYIGIRQDLWYTRELYLAQVQVLYDSRTEGNTDLNSFYNTLSVFLSVREAKIRLRLGRFTFHISSHPTVFN